MLGFTFLEWHYRRASVICRMYLEDLRSEEIYIFIKYNKKGIFFKNLPCIIKPSLGLFLH